MIRSISLALAFSLTAATASFAGPNCSALLQSQGCSCIAPLSAGGPLGQLSQIEGDVRKSGTSGYVPVKASTPLNVGDGVLIGNKGKALLTIGLACQHALGPQSSVMISSVHGCACVAMIQDGALVTAHSIGNVGEGPGSGITVAAAGAGAGIGTLYLLVRKPSPISP
jgi:hypothetical protein